MNREVVVVSAVRTAIGTFGGALKDMPPCELGAAVVREVLAAGPGRGRRCRPRGVWPCGQHRTPRHVPVARGCAARRLRPGHARVQCQSSVRLRSAGHRVGGAGHCAGRHRHRHRRWRGEHEPCALCQPDQPLGQPHGRQQDDRHDDRRAARPVPQHPHGCHRRERRGQDEHHARRPGRPGSAKATTGPNGPSRPVTSRNRSCPSCKKRARAR